MNEIKVINSTSLISGTEIDVLNQRAEQMKAFKEFLKNELLDGIDYGVIPGIKLPTLFKAGGEKVQMFLGLTPQYKLLNREFLPNHKVEISVYNNTTRKFDKDAITRNYYAWEWSCELFFGEKKVAEGVGGANSEERKWTAQYGKETPDSLANTVLKISKKRAFMDAILAVSGISDMFTQDLEDNETINKLKVDKSAKDGKISKDATKTVMATILGLGLLSSDLTQILNEMGYKNINECKKSDANIIIEKAMKLARDKKEKKDV